MSFTDLLKSRRCCIYLDEPLRIEEHARAVELEFRESMANRTEKGYILPGQTEVLYSVQETMAKLEDARILALSAMEFKGVASNSQTGMPSMPEISLPIIIALRSW